MKNNLPTTTFSTLLSRLSVVSSTTTATFWCLIMSRTAVMCCSKTLGKWWRRSVDSSRGIEPPYFRCFLKKGNNFSARYMGMSASTMTATQSFTTSSRRSADRGASAAGKRGCKRRRFSNNFLFCLCLSVCKWRVMEDDFLWSIGLLWQNLQSKTVPPFSTQNESGCSSTRSCGEGIAAFSWAEWKRRKTTQTGHV